MGKIVASWVIFLFFGIAIEWLQKKIGSNYLDEFLKANLINLLVALLALNSSTIGIVLTKVRDLLDIRGKPELFSATRGQMLVAIKEQIGLIIAAVVVLTLMGSSYLKSEDIQFLLQSILIGIGIYAIRILYDIASSVLIILDFRT